MGLSLDSIYPCSSWPPSLGLLNVDSSNKEHILCLDLLLLRPHSPPPPLVQLLFPHSCWLHPDYLLKLSFTFVLTTGHLFVALPQSNQTEIKIKKKTHLFPVQQKPSLNLKSHFPHKKRNMLTVKWIL